MPWIHKIRHNRLKDESRFLLDHSHDVVSQFGEDGIFQKLFEIIGTENKWCVEFGAWDGKNLSNTYNLIHNQNWQGVLIEGDKSRFGDLEVTYGDNERAHCFCGAVGFDADNHLESYLGQTDIPKTFDLLSIDIDGNDWHVWESLKNYRPRVVVVEFNPTVPNDVIFVQDKDPEVNQGCSLMALITLGKRKGYELACATAINGIFVVKEEFDKLGIADNDIDAMFQSAQDGRVFNAYDGTIYTIGMPRLRWGGQEISPTDLQLLSEKERQFSDRLKST
ncbi:hypothetical protein ACTL6U_07570 [Rhodovibrionaceae bacterium A322]